jgi:hypothetical protein
VVDDVSDPLRAEQIPALVDRDFFEYSLSHDRSVRGGGVCR